MTCILCLRELTYASVMHPEEDYGDRSPFERRKCMERVRTDAFSPNKKRLFLLRSPPSEFPGWVLTIHLLMGVIYTDNSLFDLS
jgi:hypothetical protein